jgi:hypothetical protein
MPKWLDTTGNALIAIFICDRCKMKRPIIEAMPDPNFPGMRVCAADKDNFDPWRLPAIQTENIALRFPRPDVSVATGPVAGQQLVTAPSPNNPRRNSIFITRDQQQSTTAGESGDIII